MRTNSIEKAGKPVEKKRITSNYVDRAAILFFVFFAVFYLLRINYGLTMIDESFYFSIPHRFLMGDQLIVDEWHVSQFSMFLQYLPFWLFYTVTGGTAGVILYFRYLFVGCWLIFYWYLYFRLRQFGWWGLVSAATFLIFVPCTCMTLNYYTMSLMAATLTGTILFFEEEQRTPVLVFCGFVFACCVLAEPFCAFIYFGYTVAVFFLTLTVKKTGYSLKKLAYLFRIRSWIWLSIGIVLCAIIVIVTLLSTSGVKEIIDAIPMFFTDAEYDFSLNGNIADFLPFFDAVAYFGYAPALIALGSVIAVFIFWKRIKTARPYIFILATVALLAAVIFEYAGSRWHVMAGMILYQPIPLYVFGFIAYLLTENKNRRLFAFWCYAALYSFIVDISSCFAVGICSGAANIVGVIFVRDLIMELLADSKSDRPRKRRTNNRNPDKLMSASIYAACFILLFTNIANLVVNAKLFFLENGAANYEGKLSYEIGKGPYKGIKTTEKSLENVEAVMDDLDIIKNNTDGPVYVTALFSWCYLYMDLPYSTYSTWYVDDDYIDRMELWWGLHPDKMPAYVYIPSCNGEAYLPELEQQQLELDYITSRFNCVVTEGKMGYIVEVLGQKT